MKGEIINNLLHTSNLKWVKSKQLIMWTWTSQYSQEIEYSSSKLNGITTKTMRKNILKEISILRVVVYDENYPRSLCLSSCIQITHISISFIKIKKIIKTSDTDTVTVLNLCLCLKRSEEQNMLQCSFIL